MGSASIQELVVADALEAAAINVLRHCGEHSEPISAAEMYARNRKRKVSGEVGEAVFATPAFVGGKIYLRSAKNLYAIGK